MIQERRLDRLARPAPTSVLSLAIDVGGHPVLVLVPVGRPRDERERDDRERRA